MTISISSSGIALDGPLVAGEKVAVSVSGLSLAAEDKPTLALLARFPDALLASVELAEDAQTPGTWTGELDTATKQTALFFATARADERRDAALELVSGRVSLARLTVPMANSALCPKPDGSPFASPVYVPVPGPPGTGGDPYDQPPEMDGEASAGASDEYARGDHRHPTDTSRASADDIAAIQGIIPATASTSNKLATAADVPSASTATPQMDGTGAAGSATAFARADHVHPSDTSKLDATGLTNSNGYLSAAGLTTGSSVFFTSASITEPMNTGAALTDADISDSVSPLGAALAAKADSSTLATVATTGNYGDLLNKPTIPAAQIQSDWNQTNSAAVDFIKNKPTIPAAQVNADWNAASGVAQILNKPTIPDVSGKADAASIAPAFSSSSTYAVGDYCTHEGLLYKCTTDVSTAGAWNASDWTEVAVTDEMGADTPLPFDAEVEYIENFRCVSPQYAAGELDVQAEVYFADGYTGSDFNIGAWTNSKCFCIYMASSKLKARYNSTNTSEINITTGTWNTVGIHGEVFFYGSSTVAISRAIFGDKATSIDVASGAGVRVRSMKIGIIGGAPVLDLIPVRVGQIGYLYDKISGTLFATTKSYDPTIGPDKAQPTITTPGRIVELTPAIRYAFASPTPTVSGTAATVACEDRAINDFTVATGITSLTITPPAAVTGRARDFFCRVTLTDSSLPTVTLSGATIDIGSTEVAGMTQGVNLLMFTEIASGHWLASRRSAS